MTAPSTWTAPARGASQPPGAGPDLLSLRLMMLLTFSTGVLDAATYLALHGVFTANMTGNVVFIGLGLAGHSGIPLARAALALGGFALGAALTGLLQRGRPITSTGDGFVALVLATVALIMVALTALLALVELAEPALDLVVVLFAVVMGAQAIAARRVGVPDVSTVVVTSTVAVLAADAGGGAARWAVQRRRLGAVLSMGVGALVGALLLHWHLAAATGLSALVVAVVALVSVVRWRRHHERPR